MNNQSLFEQYLLILKSSCEVYVHGTLESSNEDVRKLIKHGLDEILAHQDRVYQKMCEYGWYCVSNLKKNSIQQVYQSLSSSTQ